MPQMGAILGANSGPVIGAGPTGTPASSSSPPAAAPTTIDPNLLAVIGQSINATTNSTGSTNSTAALIAALAGHAAPVGSNVSVSTSGTGTSLTVQPPAQPTSPQQPALLTGQAQLDRYLTNNPDVAAAYAHGAIPSGISTPEQFALFHYQTYGQAEGRKLPTDVNDFTQGA
jgi:hypothetical protein